MGNLKSNVKRMVEAGVPEEQIAVFIQDATGKKAEPQAAPVNATESLVAARGDIFGTLGPKIDLRGLMGKLGDPSSFYRPLLEGGGAAGGSIIGTGAGLPTGPGAALTGLAGGTLGYAMGKQSADYVDQLRGLRKPPTLKEMVTGTAKDIGTGLLLEGSGQSLGAVLVPIMRGGKWLFEKATGSVRELLFKKAMESSAGKILIAHTSDGPIYAQNAKQAAEIEKEIPGLKFTVGQRSGDPNIIKLERAQMRKPGKAAEANVEQFANNNEALRSYYQKNFPGKENIDELVTSLHAKHGGMDLDVISTRQAARAKAQGMGPKDPQTVGQNALSEINEAKAPIKAGMNELEKQIPDYGMEFGGTRQAIADSLKSKKISTGQRTALEGIGVDIDEILKKGSTTHAAFGVRRTLNDKIEAAFKAGESSKANILMKVKRGLDADLEAVSAMSRTGKIADYKGQMVYPDKLAMELEENAKRIAMLKSSQTPDVDLMISELKEVSRLPHIKVKGEGQKEFLKRVTDDYVKRTGKDVPYKAIKENEAFVSKLTKRNEQIKAVLDEVEPGKDVASAMKAYNDFASSQYFARFGKGAVKQATAKGAQAAGTRAPLEKIPNQFTTPSGADDLIRAVGEENAASIMKGYYAYDLLESTTKDGVIQSGRLSTWMAKNKAVLKKYGLGDSFGKVVKAQDIADAAADTAKQFERGAAARALNADPEKAIGHAIKGTNTAAAVTELMAAVKGDAAATKGLQNAFGDHIMSQIKTTSKDIAGSPTISNAAFQRIMDKYMPAMRVLYKKDPAKLKALETMKEAYEIGIRNTKSPLGGGSDTAENVLTALSNINLLSRTATIVKGVAGAISKYSRQQIDDLVTRALFDPDYAEALVRAVKPKINQAEIKIVLDRKIVALDDYRKRRIAAVAAGMGAVALEE